MLQSPRDVVVGVSDMSRTVAFCELFGFRRAAAARLPVDAARVLYGLDDATDEQLMEVPGADRGRIRLVATPNPARRFAPFDARPFAIDLYSSDIEESVALASEHGHHCSPVADHQFGPVTIRELEITGVTAQGRRARSALVFRVVFASTPSAGSPLASTMTHSRAS